MSNQGGCYEIMNEEVLVIDRKEVERQNKQKNENNMKSVIIDSMVNMKARGVMGLQVHEQGGLKLPITEILEKYSKDYPQMYTKIPPSYTMAINHRDANTFGFTKTIQQEDDDDCVSNYMIKNVCKRSDEEIERENMDKVQQQKELLKNADPYSIDKLCKCCFKYKNLTQFNLGCNTRELQIFGVGYPLFFVTINYLQYILFIIFLTSGLYSLVSFVVLGDNCSTYTDLIEKKGLETSTNKSGRQYIQKYFRNNDICHFSIFTFTSYANILSRSDNNSYHSSNQQIISDILNLVSILVIISLLYALRYHLMKLIKEIDDMNYTAGDYTALVENIDIDYSKNLFEEIEKKALPEGIKPNCVQIQYIYDYSGFYKIQKKQQDECEKFIKLNKNHIQEAVNEDSIKKAMKIKNGKRTKEAHNKKLLKNRSKVFTKKQDEEDPEKNKEPQDGTDYYSYTKYKQNQKQLNNEIIEIQKKYLQQPYKNLEENDPKFMNIALVTFNWEGNKEGAIYFQHLRYKFSERIKRSLIRLKNQWFGRSKKNKNEQDSDSQSGQNKSKQDESEQKNDNQDDDEKYDRLIGANGPLIFRQADEPLDIIWKNIPFKNHMFMERLKIKFYIILIVFLNTVLTYFIFSTQTFMNRQIHDFVVSLQDKGYNEMKMLKGINIDKILIGAYKGLLSLVVVGMNFAIDTVIYGLVLKEQKYSVTRQNSSYMVKNTILQFINTSLIQFFLTVFLFENYFQEGGLIDSQSSVFISNAFVPIILQIVNTNYLKKIYNASLYRKAKYLATVNQFQLNELLEYPEFNQAQMYTSMLKDLFFTCFYSILIPGGIVINFIGLCVMYWVYKYNLLRRSCFKNTLSCKLSNSVINMIEYTVLIYAISSLTFQFILSRGSKTIYKHDIAKINISYIALTGVIIALVNALIPSKTVLEKIMAGEKYLSVADKQYKDTFLDFDSDYMLDNPAIRQITFNNYMDYYKEFQINKVDRVRTQLMISQKIPQDQAFHMVNQMIKMETEQDADGSKSRMVQSVSSYDHQSIDLDHEQKQE